MMSEVHKAWEGVDGVFVINLDTSHDRMEKFMKDNTGRLPLEKVHRLSAVLGRALPSYGKAPWFTERTAERASYWGGAGGCSLSHAKAIAQAKEKGWRNVLIMEDDVITGLHPDALAVLDYALKNLQGDYMLYLGYSRPTPYGSCAHREGEHALWQVEGVLSTFAYLVPESMYDRLLAIMPTEDNIWEWMSIHRAIDTFYKDTVASLPGVKTYAIQPDLVVHIDGVSDVSGSAITYTDLYDNTLIPHSYTTVRGVLHRLSAPLRRLKVKLNSLRTHRRALKGGLPGFRKRRQKKENQGK
ncbi:MAG: glycosyltransferase family 25 protein [Akkermansia sp.]|nr:glycosyltransferase family 25 protein [Akkermansia sp.]